MKYIFLAIGLLIKVIACLAVSVMFYGFHVLIFILNLCWDLNYKEAVKTFSICFSEHKNKSNSLSDVFITPYDYFFGKTVEIESDGLTSFFNH